MDIILHLCEVKVVKIVWKDQINEKEAHIKKLLVFRKRNRLLDVVDPTTYREVYESSW